MTPRSRFHRARRQSAIIQRATGNGQRATGNGQRATGNGRRLCSHDRIDRYPDRCVHIEVGAPVSDAGGEKQQGLAEGVELGLLVDPVARRAR
jgi:hypothetical protein